MPQQPDPRINAPPAMRTDAALFIEMFPSSLGTLFVDVWPIFTLAAMLARDRSESAA